MIPLRTKIIVARALCSKPVGRAVSTAFRNRIPFYGTTIDTSAPSVPESTKASLLFRLYETAEVRFVRRYLPPALDVVELGSSIGVMGAQVLRVQEPGRRLTCVEANPDLLQPLRANTKDGGSRVRIVHGAIHYPEGACETVGFVHGDSNLDGRVGGFSAGRQVQVRAFTLSEVLRESGFGHYALVCDIEGAEAGIVVYDKAALASCRLAVFELHETNFEGQTYTVDRLANQLLDVHGFELVDRYGPVLVFGRG
jgi:FkbM family methyltransferase